MGFDQVGFGPTPIEVALVVALVVAAALLLFLLLAASGGVPPGVAVAQVGVLVVVALILWTADPAIWSMIATPVFEGVRSFPG